MKSIMTHAKTTLRNYAAYRRTVAELSGMPIDTQLDLGIYSGDARRMARTAVYGA